MKNFLLVIVLIINIVGCLGEKTEQKNKTKIKRNLEIEKIEIYYESEFEEVFIHYNVDAKGWTNAPGVKMDNSGIEGIYVVEIPGNSLEFVFNNGGNSWDNNFGKNYFIKNSGSYKIDKYGFRLINVLEKNAEEIANPIKSGIYENEKYENSYFGFIDFEVDNYSYHKKLGLNIQINRKNGVKEKYLYRLKYKSSLSNGKEKWGVDEIAIYPDSNHHGEIENITFDYFLIKDKNKIVSKDMYQLCDFDEIAIEEIEEEFKSIGENENVFKEILDNSKIDGFETEFKNSIPEIKSYFSPQDNPENIVMEEIDKAIRNKWNDQNGYHYIYASVFDINDSRIVDKLIYAHKQGVDVKLLTASYHMDHFLSWETEYPKLQREGIDVIGIVRNKKIHASMHTKFSVFDGKSVSTGSYNWETRSAEDNSENMILINSETAAQIYRNLFEVIKNESEFDREYDIDSKLNIFYSQLHNIPEILYNEIEKSEKEVKIVMFTLRHLDFYDSYGNKKNLLYSLINAVNRGVKVKIILEKNIADEGEYYGNITPNDLTDEWLSSKGIEIYKIHTNMNGNKYAAVHHKYLVIDNEVTITGAYNWASYSLVSDDDIVIIRDQEVSQRYLDEYDNLKQNYWKEDESEEEQEENEQKEEMIEVEIEINFSNTMVGETVGIVGSIEEIGKWDSENGIKLDGSSWPLWKGKIKIKKDTDFEYKIVKYSDYGVWWENGNNRKFEFSKNEKIVIH